MFINKSKEKRKQFEKFSMKTDIKLYLNTCDATMHFLPIFNYFFEKYWNVDQEVIMLGYSNPPVQLPSKMKFISMSPIQHGGVNGWATYLRKYFESIEDEYIMWGIDDHLVVNYVNEEILSHMIDLIKSDTNIGRIGLTYGISNRGHKIIESLTDYDVIELDQYQESGKPWPYRIDTNYGIWRRSYLLKYLEEGYTPWDFELKGGQKAINDNYKILATNRTFAIHKVEGKRGFAPDKVNLLGAKFEDILYLIRNGIVPKQNIVGMIDWF